MSRILIVTVPSLSEENHSQIADAARKQGFEVLFFEREEDALPAVGEAEILFSRSEKLARNSPHLRWQCTPTAGINHFLGEKVFASSDFVLTNSSGAYGVTIAEHVIMLTLEMLRRQPEYNGIVRSRTWIRNLPVRSIRNSRVTVLGTGDVGLECAIRLRAFEPADLTGVNRSGRNPEMRFDRIVQQDQLDTVLPETDILIITLPGTDETFHMMDERRLGLLPDSALLVNVGRGTVVDQRALEQELRAGRLFAALDVFEKEPLPAEDPLWDCPNLLITPHAAGNTTLPYTRERIVELFLEDFENYCAGRPLARQVNLTAGY
ncbi:MAG: D-2-hydroxyacid dehydrogenase [Clostridia bacterium]|nr:D-2-hydroxyacid dehydrogenase [Clostridia bacterium]